MKKFFPFFAAVFVFLCGCGGRTAADYAWYNNAAFLKAVSASDTQKAVGIIYTEKIDLKSFNKEKQNALIYALQTTEDENIIEAVAQAGADFNAADANGRTPLQIAARSVKNQKVLLALLRSGADPSKDKDALLADASANPNPLVKQILEEAVNKTPWFKNNAFMQALKSRDKEGLRKELPFTDINAADSSGATALLASLAGPDAETINLLLGYKADVKVKYKGAPVLFLAAASVKDPAVFKALIKAGADVNAADGEGTTPLMNLAAKNSGAYAAASFLLSAQADVNAKNKQGNTALMYAVQNSSDANFINLFIKAKADVNAVNSEGIGALHIAARYSGNEKIVQLLADSGAKLDAKDKEGNTPLMLSAFNQDSLIAQVLLQAGADVSAKNNKGQTALSLAARFNAKADTPSALLKASASVENPSGILALAARNPNPGVKEALEQIMPYKASASASSASSGGKNVWYKNQDFINAVIKSDIKGLKQVLSSGINLNAMQPGNTRITSLMFAAARSSGAEVMDTLLKAGADPSLRNESGDTALSVAAMLTKNPQVISVLVSYGADINSRDNNGVSVLASAAAKNPSREVIMAILKAGASGKKEIMLKYAAKNPNKQIKDILAQSL